MTKEQRLMTLTLLKLAKVVYEATGANTKMQAKIFDDFVTAICDINGLHYSDPVSLRIHGIVITFVFVEIQIKPYRISKCFKDIEHELKALEQLSG